MDLGALLKAARKRKGLSQEELAQMIHRSRSCISKFENNQKVIDAPTLFQVANVTGAHDLIIAAMLSIDPLVAAEGLNFITQLIGGFLIWVLS